MKVPEPGQSGVSCPAMAEQGECKDDDKPSLTELTL